MIDSIEELAQKAVVGRFSQQKPYELAEFGRLALAHEGRELLEIGTQNGGTAWFFYRLGFSVKTIDVNISQVTERVSGISYIEEDSRRFRVEKQYDVIFIDAGHSYEAVKQDWGIFAPFVGAGGLIALHDIVVHPPETGCDVARFWSELKEEYSSTLEIIDSTFDNRPCCGIGVVLAAQLSQGGHHGHQ